MKSHALPPSNIKIKWISTHYNQLTRTI